MGKTIPEVDAYLAHKAAPFARPLLEHLRALFHQACPELEECIKWGVPHFEHHGILGSMAAFKQHATMGLWRGKEIEDPEGLFDGVKSTQLSGLKLRTPDDLPDDEVLLALIRAAARRNEEVAATRRADRAAGRKASTGRAQRRVRTPPALAAALATNPRAAEVYAAFPYSHKKDYAEWIDEAKREQTRARRVAQAIAWLEQGKTRHWKYRPGGK